MLLFAAPLLASAVALLVMILEAMRAQDARVLGGAAALGALVLFFLAVEIIAIRIACHRAASRRT